MPVWRISRSDTEAVHRPRHIKAHPNTKASSADEASGQTAIAEGLFSRGIGKDTASEATSVAAAIASAVPTVLMIVVNSGWTRSMESKVYPHRLELQSRLEYWRTKS